MPDSSHELQVASDEPRRVTAGASWVIPVEKPVRIAAIFGPPQPEIDRAKVLGGRGRIATWPGDNCVALQCIELGFRGRLLGDFAVGLGWLEMRGAEVMVPVKDWLDIVRAIDAMRVEFYRSHRPMDVRPFRAKGDA